MSDFNLLELLDYIDPSQLNYQSWLEVGMALKHEGYTASDWDRWSQSDPQRYNAGETYQKWDSFQESGITGATITQLAKENGWRSKSEERGHALDWNSTIADEMIVVDHGWVESKEVNEPKSWAPHEQIIQYINTLFDGTDHVGYVTETWETRDGKHLPSKGVYSRTANEIVEDLKKYKEDIGASIGDYNPEVGAWIRFNPLDGQGVKCTNVGLKKKILSIWTNTLAKMIYLVSKP